MAKTTQTTDGLPRHHINHEQTKVNKCKHKRPVIHEVLEDLLAVLWRVTQVRIDLVPQWRQRRRRRHVLVETQPAQVINILSG